MGRLTPPPFVLLECLSIADAAKAVTDGLFDLTIQPLLQAHADSGALGRGPGADLLSELASRSGWEKVAFNAKAITLQPGMALTPKGIAHGYIADRVAGMLASKA